MFGFLFNKEKKIRHRIDFNFRGRQDNPYQKEEEPNKKIKIYVIIGVISLLATISLLIYHPFFFIKNINVSGLQRIKRTDFDSAVSGMLDYKKWFIFPAKSYMFVDVNEINELIKGRFPIDLIVVKKSFPQTLDIIVEEKVSTIIYDNGKEYSYLGAGGNIVEILRQVGEDEWKITKEITTTTLADGTIKTEEKIISKTHQPPIKSIILQMGNYPIVYDKRALEGQINTPALQPETAKGIFYWFSIIEKRTNVPIGYFVISDELGNANIKTLEGWEIRVNLKSRVEGQFNELEYLLKEKITRPNLNYIDLRYPERMYWQ